MHEFLKRRENADLKLSQFKGKTVLNNTNLFDILKRISKVLLTRTSWEKNNKKIKKILLLRVTVSKTDTQKFEMDKRKFLD